MSFRVTGNGLLTLFNDFKNDILFYEGCHYSNTARAVIAAGYYSFKSDGSIRLHFVTFYEALRAAMGLPELEDEDEDEEPELSEMAQAVVDKFPEVDEEDAQDFADFLKELGITVAELNDRYIGTYKSNEEFAEEEYKKQYGDNIPTELCGHIDWEGVYDDEYYSSTDSYEYNGQNYYFRNY